MKKIFCLIFLTMLNLSSYATEKPIPLEKKVDDSDAIAVGKIISVELGEIGTYTNIPPLIPSDIWPNKRQMATITFEVTERLYGDLASQVSFITYSWRFKKDNGDPQTTTVGFNLKCKDGEEYLVYLKKLNEVYYLAFDSNQYLVHADTTKDLVQILAHDYDEYVSLEVRKKDLEKLIKQKK